MRHVIVFLFDTTEYQEDNERITEIEIQLKLTTPDHETSLFYLKIDKKKGGQYDDKFYEVIQGDKEIIFQLVLQKFWNFRKGQDLNEAFEILKNRYGNGVKFYFISCGHGAGIALNIEQKWKEYVDKFGNQPWFETEKIKSHFYSTRKSEKDLLWNFELAYALQQLSPVVGIFNNCDVNYLDSLYFYSKSIKYIISTETYLSIPMIDISELFFIVKKSVNDDLKLCKELFDTYAERVKKVIDANLKYRTLFLLDLTSIASILRLQNKVVDLILKQPNGWYEKLHNKINYEYYLNGSREYMDLFYLNKILLEIFKSIKEITELLDSLNLLINSTVGKSYVRVSRRKNRHGISVYLPKSSNPVFADLIAEYLTMLDVRDQNFLWYKLLKAHHPQKFISS